MEASTCTGGRIEAHVNAKSAYDSSITRRQRRGHLCCDMARVYRLRGRCRLCCDMARVCRLRGPCRLHGFGMSCGDLERNDLLVAGRRPDPRQSRRQSATERPRGSHARSRASGREVSVRLVDGHPCCSRASRHGRSYGFCMSRATTVSQRGASEVVVSSKPSRGVPLQRAPHVRSMRGEPREGRLLSTSVLAMTCTRTRRSVRATAYRSTWTYIRSPIGNDSLGAFSKPAITSSTRVSMRARGSSSRTVLRPSSRVMRVILIGNFRSP